MQINIKKTPWIFGITFWKKTKEYFDALFDVFYQYQVKVTMILLRDIERNKWNDRC